MELRASQLADPLEKGGGGQGGRDWNRGVGDVPCRGDRGQTDQSIEDLRRAVRREERSREGAEETRKPGRMEREIGPS